MIDGKDIKLKKLIQMHGIIESVDMAVAWKTEVRGEEVDEDLIL